MQFMGVGQWEGRLAPILRGRNLHGIGPGRASCNGTPRKPLPMAESVECRRMGLHQKGQAWLQQPTV